MHRRAEDFALSKSPGKYKLSSLSKHCWKLIEVGCAGLSEDENISLESIRSKSLGNWKIYGYILKVVFYLKPKIND